MDPNSNEVEEVTLRIQKKIEAKVFFSLEPIVLMSPLTFSFGTARFGDVFFCVRNGRGEAVPKKRRE